MPIARIKGGRMVVRVSNNITALQHKGEKAGRFAARCNELAHILQGQDSNAA